MTRRIAALAAAIASLAAPAHAQSGNDKDPGAQQAAALWIDVSRCPGTKDLESLVERKLTDWLRHLKRNDNSLTCTRLPTRKECTDKDRASLEAWAGMSFLFWDGQYGASKRAAPDCAALAARVRTMNLLQPGWQPKDGLR